MPELPEVEVVRAGLARHVVGARITGVDVLHPRPVRRDPRGPAGFAAALTGPAGDVTYAELIRLREGVLQSELQRLKARIKSGLIMQQESTSSRSGSIARDWYHLGRVRTLDELGRQVDELSAHSINAYLDEHPPSDFTFATLGPQALAIPG